MFFTGREEWHENQLAAINQIANAIEPGKRLLVDVGSLGRGYVLTGKKSIDKDIINKLVNQLTKATGYHIKYSHAEGDMSIFTISSGNQKVKFRIE